MVDAQFDFPADAKRRALEHVKRVGDDTLARILDRDNPVIGGAGLHFPEDSVDAVQCQGLHGMTEVFQGRGLGEGAFRRGRQSTGLFQRQAADILPNRRTISQRSGPVFLRRRAAVRPPFRAVEIRISALLDLHVRDFLAHRRAR
jgi:hypothetical protein